VPEYSVLLAALGILLYRHTGQEHVSITFQDGSTGELDVRLEFGNRPSLQDLVAQVLRALSDRTGRSAIPSKKMHRERELFSRRALPKQNAALRA